MILYGPPGYCPIWQRVTGVPRERLIRFATIALDGAWAPAVVEAAESCWAPTHVERAQRVARLVQRLPYHPDPPDGDWVRPPCRTLAEGGDCDCLAVLACALDEVLRLPWRLGWMFNPPGAALDHVAPQVRLAGRWHWQEVTLPGARVGEHPREAVRRLGFGERVTG